MQVNTFASSFTNACDQVSSSIKTSGKDHLYLKMQIDKGGIKLGVTQNKMESISILTLLDISNQILPGLDKKLQSKVINDVQSIAEQMQEDEKNAFSSINRLGVKILAQTELAENVFSQPSEAEKRLSDVKIHPLTYLLYSLKDDPNKLYLCKKKMGPSLKFDHIEFEKRKDGTLYNKNDEKSYASIDEFLAENPNIHPLSEMVKLSDLSFGYIPRNDYELLYTNWVESGKEEEVLKGKEEGTCIFRAPTDPKNLGLVITFVDKNHQLKKLLIKQVGTEENIRLNRQGMVGGVHFEATKDLKADTITNLLDKLNLKPLHPISKK